MHFSDVYVPILAGIVGLICGFWGGFSFTAWAARALDEES